MSHVRFRPTGRPRASIVVLAWKQTDLLLACLRSLAQTLSGEVPYEVIVVSNDAPQAILDAVGSDLRELASVCSQLVADTNGKVDVDANGLTQLLLDISSYFAP